LNSARERGRSASCLNNFKQCGTGIMMYADDHNGAVLLKGDDGGGNIIYVMVNGGYSQYGYRSGGTKYLPGFESALCPSAKFPHLQRMGDTGESYMGSHYAEPYCAAAVPKSASGDTIDHMPDAAGYTAVLFTHRVKAPSSLMLLNEAWNENRDYQYHGYNWWDSLPDFRHNGRMQMIFADGHASSYSKEEASAAWPDKRGSNYIYYKGSKVFL